MDQSSQLRGYIQQGINSGLSEDNIRSRLLQAGWPQAVVDAALYMPSNYTGQESNVPNPAQPTNTHRVRNGVLWILSPFIILVGVAVLQFLFRAAGIKSPIFNIISILAGMVGVILVPVGPIVGIIKLSRRQ